MKTGIRLTLAALLLSVPLASNAGVFVSVSIAPPPLLVYDQPPIPGPDYVWVPGYWAWDPEWEDYYWVPGTWSLAPEPYFYWTPGYWAWLDTVFVWHEGYWGPHVGDHGGADYGYGQARRVPRAQRRARRDAAVGPGAREYAAAEPSPSAERRLQPRAQRPVERRGLRQSGAVRAFASAPSLRSLVADADAGIAAD